MQLSFRLSESMSVSVYDCVIIGSGPAGLTCAIFIGRYRRSVLVVHHGLTRNYASHGVNGFLGQHGIVPAELFGKGRAEAESVGVEFRETRAERVTRSGELFEIETTDGVLRSRRVVFAYGVRDQKPDLPNFEHFYGRGIHHCPDCDGYEARDLPVGVIGSGKAAAGLALKMLQWTERVRIFTNGSPKKMTAEQTSKLLARSIDVRQEKIIELIPHPEHARLAAVVLESGERVEVEAMFFTLGVERATTLAEDLGCEVSRTKPNVKVNRFRETTVRGAYAVGDLVEGSQLVVTAAADGAIAAIQINKSLMEPSRKV